MATRREVPRVDRKPGESLLLPNVATWWCGRETERRFVLDNLADLVVAPAFVARLPGPLDKGPEVVAEMADAERKGLAAAIGERGVDFVGQEAARLSTTPVWINGRLEPRPFLLRVYVAATQDGWRVMPGGLGLIGERDDARAVTMQRGARSADVWVMSGGPVHNAPLLPATGHVVIRRATGALPSRAADNLFWLARYLERAEATLRAVRALAARLAERDSGEGGDTVGLAGILLQWGAIVPPAQDRPRSAAAQALFGKSQGALPQVLEAARNAASAIRDRFPRDSLRALDDLYAFVHATARAAPPEGQVLDKANTALRMIAAIAGFQAEGMNRLSGWRFLQLGLRIERAITTCRLARQFGGLAAGSNSLATLLELAESQMTYRVRYLLGPARLPVLDLVLLDDANPRSLGFQIGQIIEHLATLPNPRADGRNTPAGRLATALARDMRALTPAGLNNEWLIGVENRLMRLSNEISQSYFNYRGPAVARAERP
jgi:uncharacterized alpha-E superfamily protein